MSKKVIDNPDLHLGLIAEFSAIKQALQKVLNREFTLITDLLDYDFANNKPSVWVHLRSSDNKKYPTTLSIYGTAISLRKALLLAAELNCSIISDFDSNLKQHQWQLIKPDGSIEVVSGSI